MDHTKKYKLRHGVAVHADGNEVQSVLDGMTRERDEARVEVDELRKLHAADCRQIADEQIEADRLRAKLAAVRDAWERYKNSGITRAEMSAALDADVEAVRGTIYDPIMDCGHRELREWVGPNRIDHVSEAEEGAEYLLVKVKEKP